MLNKKNIIENLETGDIILYSEHKYFYEKVIQYFTNSKYTHIAMILKDPIYINPSLKGLYIIESGVESFNDAEDNEKKFGVQIVSFDKIMEKWEGEIFVRKLHCKRNEDFYKKLSEVHEMVHNKSYDLLPQDWIEAALGIGHTKTTNRFWCSALISYIYIKLGLLDKSLEWSLVTPNEFGTENNKSLKFINCYLDKEIKLN